MSGRQHKKLRKIAKKWAKNEMLANILVYQSLPLFDRLRVAFSIVFKRGDGTPKK